MWVSFSADITNFLFIVLYCKRIVPDGTVLGLLHVRDSKVTA